MIYPMGILNKLFLIYVILLEIFIFRINYSSSFLNHGSFNIINPNIRSKFISLAKFSQEQLERIKKFEDAFLESKTALSYGDSKRVFDSFISQIDEVTSQDLKILSPKLTNMASYLFMEIDKLGDYNLLEFLATRIMSVGISMPEIGFTSITGTFLRLGNIEKTIEWLDKLRESGLIPKHRTYIRLFRELANNTQTFDISLMNRLFDDMEFYKVPVSPEISAFAILALIKNWASSMTKSTTDTVDSVFDELENGIRNILSRWKKFKFSDKMLNIDTAIWLNNIFKLLVPPTCDEFISKISNVTSENDVGICSNCPITIGCDIIQPETRFNIFTKWLQDTFRYNRSEIPSLSIFYTRLYRAHVMNRPYKYILDGANIGLHLRGRKYSYSNFQVEVIRGLLERRGLRSLIILPKAMGFPLVSLNSTRYEDMESSNPILSRLTYHSNMLNTHVISRIKRYVHDPIQWNIYKEWCNMDVIHVCEDDCYDDNYMFLASIATLSTPEALFVEKLLAQTLNIKPMDNKFNISNYDGSDPSYVVTQDTIREFCISGVSKSDLLQWKEHSLIPYQMSHCLNPTHGLNNKNLTGKELFDAVQDSYDEAGISNENLPSSYWPGKPKVFLGHAPKYSLRITNKDNLWHFPISLERLYFNCDSRYKSRMQFITDVACMPFYLTTSMPELFLQKASRQQTTDWLCLNLNILDNYRKIYKSLLNENPDLLISYLEGLVIPERMRTQPFPGNRWIVASKRGMVLKDVKTSHIIGE